MSRIGKQKYRGANDPITPEGPTSDYWNAQARGIIDRIPSLPIDVSPHEYIAIRLQFAYEDGEVNGARLAAKHDPKSGSMFAKRGRRP